MDLAAQLGLEVPKKFKEGKDTKDLKGQMMKASQTAAEFYCDMLLNHKRPRLKRRTNIFQPAELQKISSKSIRLELPRTITQLCMIY